MRYYADGILKSKTKDKSFSKTFKYNDLETKCFDALKRMENQINSSSFGSKRSIEDRISEINNELNDYKKREKAKGFFMTKTQKQVIREFSLKDKNNDNVYLLKEFLIKECGMTNSDIKDFGRSYKQYFIDLLKLSVFISIALFFIFNRVFFFENYLELTPLSKIFAGVSSFLTLIGLVYLLGYYFVLAIRQPINLLQFYYLRLSSDDNKDNIEHYRNKYLSKTS